MYSGKLAAATVAEALAAGHNGEAGLTRYERRVRRALEAYWELVEGFYTQPFIELFFEPRARFDLPSAIVALLAGELEGGWAIRWRLRLFVWLVKLQARFRLVPRIDFGAAVPPPVKLAGDDGATAGIDPGAAGSLQPPPEPQRATTR
jgi:FADH2-dependent halogenase